MRWDLGGKSNPYPADAGAWTAVGRAPMRDSTYDSEAGIPGMAAEAIRMTIGLALADLFIFAAVVLSLRRK